MMHSNFMSKEIFDRYSEVLANGTDNTYDKRYEAGKKLLEIFGADFSTLGSLKRLAQPLDSLEIEITEEKIAQELLEHKLESNEEAAKISADQLIKTGIPFKPCYFSASFQKIEGEPNNGCYKLIVPCPALTIIKEKIFGS